MRKILFSVFVFAIVFGGFLSLPIKAFGASNSDNFEMSGWIPYWNASKGIKDAKKRLNQLDIIHPFAYIIQKDGDIKDEFGMRKSAWKSLAKSANKKDVLIVPTVMSSDRALIHEILSDKNKREDHIDQIVKEVKKRDYDGIDIDYENKSADTRVYFSLFLKELKEELDKLDDKILSCTVEARTPPDSLYREVPANIEYANDYNEISKYCDRVTIMAYDQGRADYKLNSAKTGAPYIPVADIDWVKKVVDFTALTIPKEKLVLGIPTYGYEYEVTVSPNWFQDYKKLWSLNPVYADDTADDYDVKPSRNKAGEMSFSYIPDDSSLKLKSSIKAPKGTPSGEIEAARALVYANETGQTVKVNYVTWSDKVAILDKVKLAKELGLRGASIFKIDGGEENFWSGLKKIGK